MIDFGADATAPDAPERQGYRFGGWNTSFNGVMSDLVVKAEYVRQYTVTFIGYNNEILDVKAVDEGKGVTPPTAPSVEGFDFVGWNADLTCLSSDITVNAVYTVKTYTVRFVMPDGTPIGDAQSVEHGFSAISPSYPDFYMTGSGDSIRIYGFTRWSVSFESITADTVIEAVYETAYTKPVVIVEFSGIRNGDVNVYIYNCGSVVLNAIELEISYKASVGNIVVERVDFNSAGPFRDSNKYQYVINNNENVFTYAWSDANGAMNGGVPYDGCAELATFSFTTALGATVSPDTFTVLKCSAVTSDTEGNDLDSVIPAVVYCYKE